MKTFFLACLLALTAMSGIVVTTQSADAGGKGGAMGGGDSGR
jgi:hypothetical protein